MNMSEIKDFLNTIIKRIVNNIDTSNLKDFLNNLLNNFVNKI